MGVIDKVTATVSCATCNIDESHSAVEKGSSFGSGGWRNFDEFKNFDVVISREQCGPSVTSATCKKCSGPARVTEKLG
jgi:hypothetical protein